MLHRPKSRLAAAAVAGAVCALTVAGAAIAGTAKAAVWTGSAAAVPNVYTNATPGLAAFYKTGQNVAGLFLVWKGQLDNRVHYKYRLDGTWSGNGTIPGAFTTTSPAAAFYTDPNSTDAELVVWKKLRSDELFYSQGEISATGAINWTTPAELPGGSLTASSSAPAVLFPLNSVNARVIVAWRGPFNHVRYELGTPSGRGFAWTGLSYWIGPGTSADPTTTSAAPALTEILSDNGSLGTIYVFWKDLATKAVSYAAVSDNAGTGLPGAKSLPWTLLGQVPGAGSTAGPAVSSIDAHGDGPLLLAYKGPGGEHIRFQLLTPGGWSGVMFVTGPNSTTTLGPALVNGTLASVSPTTSGRVYLHTYTG